MGSYLLVEKRNQGFIRFLPSGIVYEIGNGLKKKSLRLELRSLVLIFILDWKEGAQWKLNDIRRRWKTWQETFIVGWTSMRRMQRRGTIFRDLPIISAHRVVEINLLKPHSQE